MLRRSPEKLYIQTLHGPSIHGEVITRTIEEATYQVKAFVGGLKKHVLLLQHVWPNYHEFL